MQQEQNYPILEFDPTPEAIIEPKRLIKPIDIPEHAVACFFQDVITQFSQQHKARVIKHLRSEIGTHPVYELDVAGKRLAVFHPGVGAPLAAGMLEEVIALGCRKFIACGGAGVLDGTVVVGHPVIPTAGMREHHIIIFPRAARSLLAQRESLPWKRFSRLIISSISLPKRGRLMVSIVKR